MPLFTLCVYVIIFTVQEDKENGLPTPLPLTLFLPPPTPSSFFWSTWSRVRIKYITAAKRRGFTLQWYRLVTLNNVCPLHVWVILFLGLKGGGYLIKVLFFIIFLIIFYTGPILQTKCQYSICCFYYEFNMIWIIQLFSCQVKPSFPQLHFIYSRGSNIGTNQ